MTIFDKELRSYTNKPHCLLGFHLLLELLSSVFRPAMGNAVHWKVQSYPVLFGESITLFCNTSSVQDKCKLCQKIWYGGTNQELLSYNGFPVNHLKHETTEETDGFTLIIKNFEESDIEWYSCAYGFYYDNKELQLTDHLEIHPTNETSSITQFIDSGFVLNVRVDFKKVHPPPRCNIFLNGEDLSSLLLTKPHQEGIFYRVTVDFQHNLKPNHCVGKLELACNIGTKNATIISSDLTNLCTDNTGNKDEQSRPSTTEIVKHSLPSTIEIVKHSLPLTTEIMDQYLPSTTEIVQQFRLSITEIVGIGCGVAVLIVIVVVLILVFVLVHVSKRIIYKQIKMVSLQQA